MLLLVEEDVRGLDVAVDEPARVRSVERARDLATDGERPLRLERAFLGEQRLQFAAGDVAHSQVELPVDLAGVVDRDNVRVLERSCNLRLRQEPLAEARMMLRETQRLTAVIQRVFSGRSTSQKRMMRVTSVLFSAEWMNVSSKSTSWPLRHE